MNETEPGATPASGEHSKKVETQAFLGYPIGNEGSDGLGFIKRVTELLKDPQTAIYVDTSFLMWLTKGGSQSRLQFVKWAQTVSQRIHVPVWTYHEYYRHHTRDTLRGDLAAEAKKLKDAAKRYIEIAQTYADDPLKPGFSEDGFGRELVELQAKIKEVTETAERWDYETAAIQLRDWMSERLCRSRAVFDLMDRIGQTGDSRYTQDMPPGYMDRIKMDTPDKGSNKFGDLIMWEEVLAHAAGKGVKNVVVMTRDRKVDWFARANEPNIEDDLGRLRRRWDPVPAPHPTLVIELRERTQAKELVLLDSLYLGAVLHHVGGQEYSRLIAYALGVSSSTYASQVQKTQTDKSHDGLRRPQSVPLSMRKARSLCQAAAVPIEPATLAEPVLSLLTQLRGDLPTVEAFVAGFTSDALSPLPLEDTARFARAVADEALKDGGHLARSMADRLLALLPTTKAEVAASVYAGFLCSAYYEGALPRAIPTAWNLQALFDQLEDAAYANVLTCFGRDLHAVRSEALFIPASPPSRLRLRFAHDASQEQTPMVLQQISLEDKNLLMEVGISLPGNLFAILGSRRVVSAGDLLQVTANQFGLPLKLLDASGAEIQDDFTLHESLGFISAEDTQTAAEAADTPSDAELEAIPEEELALQDEDSMDAKSFLDDDSDE